MIAVIVAVAIQVNGVVAGDLERRQYTTAVGYEHDAPQIAGVEQIQKFTDAGADRRMLFAGSTFEDTFDVTKGHHDVFADYCSRLAGAQKR